MDMFASGHSCASDDRLIIRPDLTELRGDFMQTVVVPVGFIVVLLMVFVLFVPSSTSFGFDSTVFLIIVLGLIVAFRTFPVLRWLVNSVYIFKKLIYGLPTVVLCSDGLTDYASVLGVGLVRWDEMDEVFPFKYRNQYYIAVRQRRDARVVQRMGYPDRVLNSIGRALSRGGELPEPLKESLVWIPERNIPYSVNQMMRLLVEESERHSAPRRIKFLGEIIPGRREDSYEHAGYGGGVFVASSDTDGTGDSGGGWGGGDTGGWGGGDSGGWGGGDSGGWGGGDGGGGGGDGGGGGGGGD